VYKDLREWITQVESAGQLHRVGVPVSWNLEMSTVSYMASYTQQSPAVLFENPTDSGIPGTSLLWNMLGSSEQRIALGLGLDPDLPTRDLIRATRELLARPLIAPRMIDASSAPVTQNSLFGEQIDLTRLPVPRMWPLDGGRYLGTGDVVITRDPEDGTVNVGTYRQMLQGPREVGFYVSPGKDAFLQREKYWSKGQPCPVVAVYGVDPLLFMLGSQGFARDVSEFDVGGGIRGEGIEVVIGPVTGLPIPAHAEIAVEGFAYPGDMKPEGPFGEFTGYYGKPEADAPVIKVEAVHHRDAPILTCALMAEYPACEQNTFFSIIRSAKIWDDLEKLGVPGIRGAYSHPAAAGGFGLVIVSLKQARPGHAAQVLALAAQCPAAAYYTKWIVAVDDDVDPTKIDQVLWAMTTRCNPSEDIDVLRMTWSSPLDPSQNPPEKRPFGSKALVNACKDYRHIKTFSTRSHPKREVCEQVAKRWTELGFSAPVPDVQSVE